jgi:hypothetical protein
MSVLKRHNLAKADSKNSIPRQPAFPIILSDTFYLQEEYYFVLVDLLPKGASTSSKGGSDNSATETLRDAVSGVKELQGQALR